MKKILFFGIVFVAIASFGGNIISAHAQALTPADRAALEQKLQVLRATLVQLQMQQGSVPPAEPAASVGSAPIPVASVSYGLSTGDVVALNSALDSLKGLLVTLQSKIASDPQFIATNGATVVAALGNIGHALALMGTSLGGSSASAANALPAAPASGVAASADNTTGGPIAQQGAVPSVAPQPASPSPLLSVGQTNETQSPAVTVAQTAQVSSSWSFLKNLNWPLVIVVLLALAAVALWLWWPSEEEDVKVAVFPQGVSPMKQVMPLASRESPAVKIMPPQPQQQQRKSA